MKESKNIIFIAAIISVLLCIPIGIFIGKVLYDTPNNVSSENNQEINKDESSITDNDAIYNLYKMTDILAQFSLTGETINLYKNLGLNDNDKTYISLSMLSYPWIDLTLEEQNTEEYMCTDKYTNYENVNSKLKEMFEGDASKDFEAKFPYYYKDEKYYESGCGGFGMGPIVEVYNYKFSMKDDVYYVYQAVGIITPNNDVYTDVEMKNPIQIENLDSQDFITEKNYNSFSKYRLSFKRNGNNFIFHKIEKI